MSITINELILSQRIKPPKNNDFNIFYTQLFSNMMIKTKVLGLFIIVMLLMTIISAYRVTTQSKEVFLKKQL